MPYLTAAHLHGEHLASNWAHSPRISSMVERAASEPGSTQKCHLFPTLVHTINFRTSHMERQAWPSPGEADAPTNKAWRRRSMLVRGRSIAEKHGVQSHETKIAWLKNRPYKALLLAGYCGMLARRTLIAVSISATLLSFEEDDDPCREECLEAAPGCQGKLVKLDPHLSSSTTEHAVGCGEGYRSIERRGCTG